MTDHRSDYIKTVLTAAMIALGSLMTLSWLLCGRLVTREPWSISGWMLWLIGCILLLGCEAVSVLVFVGGLIALRRDALETRGLPYAPQRPLEWRAGPMVSSVRKAIRTLRAIKGLRSGQLDLRPGERVIVRQLDEIIETLDGRGMRDCLPFMPEMAAWCGRQTRVLRRVDKVYDWILGTGLRRMWDTVYLEGSRCDGRAHGGCQADCQLMWKEAWLKRPAKRGERLAGTGTTSVLRPDLHQLSQWVDDKTAEPRYVCQMTQWPRSTTPLSWHDPRHYLRDLLSGNVRAGRFVAGTAIAVFNSVQRRFGGAQFPMCSPRKSQNSQNAALDLRPGELVRIKSKREIEATLDARMRNRGLWFAPDLLRFCGGKYRVLMRVNRLIDEKSGKMIGLSNPCIVLEGIADTGDYIAFVVLNERIYWREVWLERVLPEASGASALQADQERR